MKIMKLFTIELDIFDRIKSGITDVFSYCNAKIKVVYYDSLLIKKDGLCIMLLYSLNQFEINIKITATIRYI